MNDSYLPLLSCYSTFAGTHFHPADDSSLNWLVTAYYYLVCCVRLDVLCLQIDVDGTGGINIAELGDALSVVGLKLPAYEAVSYTHLTLPTKRIV